MNPAQTTEAEVVLATPENIQTIVKHILSNKIVAMPYGKKERRVFALVGLANENVVKRMKKIKERADSQAVAISGIPDVAPFVAELDKTPALVEASNRLGKSPEQIVYDCFKLGGVGLVLTAQDWLPEGSTMLNKDGVRTVLIAGEAADEEYDIFPKVYRQLIKEHKKVMVGTSANLHGEDTYHALQQDEALDKLKHHIDTFVYDKSKIGRFPLFKHLTSVTMIDLSIYPPVVIRWGSVYPKRFKKLFPKLVFKPKDLKHANGREEFLHTIIKGLGIK